jgi:hypothetical protein
MSSRDWQWLKLLGIAAIFYVPVLILTGCFVFWAFRKKPTKKPPKLSN